MSGLEGPEVLPATECVLTAVSEPLIPLAKLEEREEKPQDESPAKAQAVFLSDPPEEASTTRAVGKYVQDRADLAAAGPVYEQLQLGDTFDSLLDLRITAMAISLQRGWVAQCRWSSRIKVKISCVRAGWRSREGGDCDWSLIGTVDKTGTTRIVELSLGHTHELALPKTIPRTLPLGVSAPRRPAVEATRTVSSKVSNGSTTSDFWPVSFRDMQARSKSLFAMNLAPLTTGECTAETPTDMRILLMAVALRFDSTLTLQRQQGPLRLKCNLQHCPYGISLSMGEDKIWRSHNEGVHDHTVRIKVVPPILVSPVVPKVTRNRAVKRSYHEFDDEDSDGNAKSEADEDHEGYEQSQDENEYDEDGDDSFEREEHDRKRQRVQQSTSTQQVSTPLSLPMHYAPSVPAASSFPHMVPFGSVHSIPPQVAHVAQTAPYQSHLPSPRSPHAGSPVFVSAPGTQDPPFDPNYGAPPSAVVQNGDESSTHYLAGLAGVLSTIHPELSHHAGLFYDGLGVNSRHDIIVILETLKAGSDDSVKFIRDVLTNGIPGQFTGVPALLRVKLWRTVHTGLP